MAEVSEILKSAKEALAKGAVSETLALLKSLKNAALGDYTFACKIAKLSDKAAPLAESLKPLKIALLSSSTLTFLEPLVRYFCAIEGFRAEVRSGDFGSWRNEILDAASWLYEFKPDIAIIATNYRDANMPQFSENPQASADAVADEFEAFWRAFKGRSPASLVQQNFDMPACDSAGFLSQTNASSRVQLLKRANIAMLERAQKCGVSVLDICEVRASVGAANWEDSRMWMSARQHPSFAALPKLAAEYARAVCAIKRPSKKVCVLDLDNTLWGGIIGEDGLGAIKLGAPDPVGEAYVQFQKYLRELGKRGILLAACSKNNEADALLPFEKHPDMALKRSDFAAFKANWNLKSENISQIAKELNLGLDSFVFVDDNPAEIEQVKAALPMVECVLLPQDTSEFVAALDSRNFFDSANISEDDFKRAETYIQNSMRAEAQSASNDPKDFLKSLEMRGAACEISELNLVRAAQLAGKTNQFNLTTRRHSAEKISEIASRKNAYAKTFSLSDKYGDMGIVGLVLASDAGGGILEADTFLLSCRALGRTLEEFIFADLISAARAMGYAKIRGVYIPTEKNSQTAGLYEKFGFSKENESADGSSTWLLSIASAKIPSSFIA